MPPPRRSGVNRTAPNQRWVGDTTDFVIGESGKLYLAAVLDLYSRFIVGWAVSAANDRHLAITALEQAVSAAAPDQMAALAALKTAGGTCGACHKTYRVQDENMQYILKPGSV